MAATDLPLHVASGCGPIPPSRGWLQKPEIPYRRHRIPFAERSLRLTNRRARGITSITEPNDSASLFSYDAAARPAETTSPHGAKTTYTYTASPKDGDY